MPRPRVVDTYDLAKRDRETFHDSKVTRQVQLPCSWPEQVLCVGQGWGVLYHSDKWGRKDNYKHLKESDWKILVNPEFDMRFDDRNDLRRNPDLAPVKYLDEPMPRHVAYLGKCLGVQGILNDGRIVHIEIPGSHLAAARVPGDEERATLLVYSDQVDIIIVGDDLDILRDGVSG